MQTHNQQTLTLIVEGKSYNWNQQYITSAQIRHLAGLSADTELYLSVPEPWKDEVIVDGTSVDLARPEIEHFYVKKKLSYTINGVEFESDRQYIKGKQIRKQGNIPESQEIFLSIKGPWDDELINDDEFVDLARPGIEHFFSKEKICEVTLIVNGREKLWKEKNISYAQVVKLAFDDYQEVENRVYTVTYKKGPDQNPQGSMVKGDTVIVKNKMIFNVTPTDKS
jgi:hypothetical protein